MPLGIDFDAIAEAFRLPLTRITVDLRRAFERLKLQLTRRTASLAELERGSRDFPVVGFSYGSVRAYVDRAQHRSLGVPETGGVGAALNRAGAAFSGGIGRVGQAIEEELILPRLFGSLLGILDMVLSSVERFAAPSAGMFDARARTGSDIFGLAGLLFRTFGADTGRAFALSNSVREARKRLGRAFPGDPPPAAPTVEAPLTDRLVAMSDDLVGSFAEGVQLIAGALLLVPLLPAIFENALRSVGLVVRMHLLDSFAGIVDSVFELRAWLADFLAETLPDLLGQGLALIRAAAMIIVNQLSYFLRFGVVYVTLLIVRLDSFLDGLTRFMSFWQQVVTGIVGVIDAILDFDLMPIFLTALGSVGGVIAAVGNPPRFTIADLFGVAGSAARIGARTALQTWIAAARLALLSPTWLGSDMARRALRKLDAISDLVNIALQPMSAQLQGTELRPASLNVSMPNLFAVLFPDGGAGLRDSVATLGQSLVDAIVEILHSGVGMLAAAGEDFLRLATATAREPLAGRYGQVAMGAVREADLVFGNQVADLQGLSARRADPLAKAFEIWLAGAGFQLLTTAIPAYIGEMRRYWHAESEAEPPPAPEATPTSPHILARRERLGRVRVPQLTVRVVAEPSSEGLATIVALRVKDMVEQGYRTGLGHLAPGAGE